MPNKCDKVLPLRQYGQTCWFNSILMAVLYSDESRKLLLKKSEEWDDKIKVLDTIKFILKHKYLRSGDYDQDYPLFDKIRPETILKELYDHNHDIFQFNPDVSSGLIPAMYIKNVYKLLGVKVLFLDKRGEKLFYSIFNTIGKYVYDENGTSFGVNFEKLDTLIEDFKDPDVIIINAVDNYVLAKYPEHHNLNSSIFKKAFNNIHKNENVDNFITQVIDLKNNIVINTEDYVLDSVMLGNWNKGDIITGHSITGITCEGDKYVYNGEPRLRLPENTTTPIEIQCELTKFDWNINEENDFCINLKECHLAHINSNSSYSSSTHQCFSFNKGIRNVIYVKKNKTNTLNIKKNNCPLDSTTNPLTDKCDTLENINKLPEHRLSYPEKIQMSGNDSSILINTIFEGVIVNNILLIITLILFALVLLSAYPILYLKYYKDLYENINIFNDICYNNTIKYNSNIPIKDTFIWKVSNILFDFDKIDKKFKIEKEVDDNLISISTNDKNIDFHRINKSSSNDDLLIIYDKYVKYSIPIILFMIILFTIQCIYNCINEKLSINDIVVVVYIFIYLAVVIAFFSTILKSIMDLYLNTDVYKYIMLLKELDIILKEGKDINSNVKIISILKKYSNDENINIEEVNLNKSLIDELIKLKYDHLIKNRDDILGNYKFEKIKTNDKINITLENIDNMKKYISNESNQKIFKQIDKISYFLFAYIFLLLPPLYILSILLKKIYIFCLFFIIGMLIFLISIYNMYYVIR